MGLKESAGSSPTQRELKTKHTEAGWGTGVRLKFGESICFVVACPLGCLFLVWNTLDVISKLREICARKDFVGVLREGWKNKGRVS